MDSTQTFNQKKKLDDLFFKGLQLTVVICRDREEESVGKPFLCVRTDNGMTAKNRIRSILKVVGDDVLEELSFSIDGNGLGILQRTNIGNGPSVHSGDDGNIYSFYGNLFTRNEVSIIYLIDQYEKGIDLVNEKRENDEGEYQRFKMQYQMQPLRHVPVPSLLQERHPVSTEREREKKAKKSVTWDSGIESVRSAADQGFPGKIVTWMMPLITHQDPFFGPHDKPPTRALSPLETHRDWYVATEEEICRENLRPTDFFYRNEIPKSTFDTRRFDVNMEKRLYVKPDSFEVIQVYPYRYRSRDGSYVHFWLDQCDVSYGECTVFYPSMFQIKYKYVMRDNTLDGTFESFYPNGMVSVKCSYVDGKLHGKLYWYDSIGTLVNEEMYNKGERCGTWKVWSDEKEDYVTIVYD